MQRLTLLVSLVCLSVWTPNGLSSRVDAQQPAPTPPEGAVWYNPAKPEGSLIKPNAWRDWRRNNQIKFQNALRVDNPSAADKQELEAGSKIYTDRLTDPEEIKDLPNVTNEILNRINSFGRGGALKHVLETLTRDLSNLFKQKSPVVRVNAAIFLGRLDSEPAPLGGGKEAVRYWPAYLPLIGAIEDPNQEVAVKVAAAVGLRDILRLSDIPRLERDDLIIRLTKQLDIAADPANWPAGPVKREYYWAFTLKLVEALREADAAVTLTRDPVQVTSLVSLIKDDRQDWRVRSRALRAISEFPLEEDNTFDMSSFAKLGGWLMNEAITDFQAKPNDSHWRETFFDIYLSFRPLSKAEFDRGFGFESKAEMAKFRGAAADVKAAFDVISPVMALIAPAPPAQLPRLPNDVIKALEDYVKANPIMGIKVHPRVPAL